MGDTDDDVCIVEDAPTSCGSKTSEESINKEIRQVRAHLADVESKMAKLQERRTQLKKREASLKERLVRAKNSVLSERQWDADQFTWSASLTDKAQSVFEVLQFRPLQLAAMNASLSGHDVLLVMPTGGGKSLCYQLPAVAVGGDGLTLVIAPLLSLIEDQIAALRRRGVVAAVACASTPANQLKRIHSDMLDGSSDLRLLYVTPEKLAKSKRFMAKLQKVHQQRRLRMLAIDEVHCCSQWGHDFRPDYRFLGIMRDMFPRVPIMGLTATCTPAVMRDVQKMLKIGEAVELRADFNRPNLFYEVLEKPAATDACVELLAEMINGRFARQSGIVYTTTVKDTEMLAARLATQGVSAAAYHAHLPPERRSHVHTAWLDGRFTVVVATVAFGMGIDKPDVRFVIHHCMSKSVHNYYQESGRAGRDGRPAHCVLLFRLADVFRLSSMVFAETSGLRELYAMCAYCVNGSRCRRRLLAASFVDKNDDDDDDGQSQAVDSVEAPACECMCDVCRREVSKVATHEGEQDGEGQQEGMREQQLDISQHARTVSRLLNEAHARDSRLTALKLVDSWLADGDAPTLPRRQTERCLAQLLLSGHVREDFHFTPYSTISYLVSGPCDGVYPLLVDAASVHSWPAEGATPVEKTSGGRKQQSTRKASKRARIK